MAVRIRLARRGRKARAMYDIVVADVRSPRDGRFIEKLGYYNPNTNPATIVLNDDSALNWVMNGAQASDTARAILSHKGVMMRKHLQVGVNKGAITQDDADKRFNKWLADKEGKILAQLEGLESASAADRKARLEAETKVNADRAERLANKQAEMAAAIAAEEAGEEEVAAEAAAEEVVEEVKAEAVVEEVVEEVVAEAAAEEVVEEAKAEAVVEEVVEEVVAEEVVAEAAAEEVVEEAKTDEASEEKKK
jgi:small subunit ribosomal protein S16